MKFRGIIALIASAFGFAVMAACVRLCDDYGAKIPCFEKAFFRNAVALVIALFAWQRGSERLRASGRTPWLLLGLRSVLGTAGIFANFYALSHIPIAEGQTLNKIAPFCTVIFAWWFLGERAGWRQLMAVLVAFAGALLVIKPGFAGVYAFPLAMGALGGVCAGGAYAAVRALGARKTSPALIVLFFSAFSCLVSIPLTMLNYVPLNGAQLLILAGAGAGAAMGQFGVTLAYRYAAPREIAVYDYTNIIFTAALGYLLFGQLSDGWSLLGMAVIVLGAVMLTGHPQASTATSGGGTIRR